MGEQVIHPLASRRKGREVSLWRTFHFRSRWKYNRRATGCSWPPRCGVLGPLVASGDWRALRRFGTAFYSLTLLRPIVYFSAPYAENVSNVFHCLISFCTTTTLGLATKAVRSMTAHTCGLTLRPSKSHGSHVQTRKITTEKRAHSLLRRPQLTQASLHFSPFMISFLHGFFFFPLCVDAPPTTGHWPGTRAIHVNFLNLSPLSKGTLLPSVCCSPLNSIAFAAAPAICADFVVGGRTLLTEKS
ncbi:hypothetical protein ABL78_2847 [Leptomonas seymouri]|uniref:Uncharacterized protein n=1 Tax=Leptomonas seymouri TaxID=5684 RepID=A0A0N1ILP0_LEPSE|nr:hypothetical protein ABL78_2847 [Leptomonas seymouri]|eukprot:KPI88071.1 hypothetical protein ABL78_2847 [Leptomonas seymouri]